nr:transposase [Arsenophonus apicola]
MLILKAYKFRLEPTEKQSQRLRQLCGCARFIWNYGLAETQRIIESGGKLPSAFELNRMLTEWKKKPEHSFCKKPTRIIFSRNSKICTGHGNAALIKNWQQKLLYLKGKNDGRDSVRFVNFDKYCQLDNGRVRLPSGLVWVKFRQSQKLYGKIKNATVSQHAGHWYISFQVELEMDIQPHSSATMIGLDAGVTRLATLSDGTVFEPVNSFKTNQKKLAKFQRQLSCKVKFSNNWKNRSEKSNVSTRI